MKSVAVVFLAGLICLLIAVPAIALDVDDVKAAIEAKGANWTAGKTSVSGLTDKEMEGWFILESSVPDWAEPAAPPVLHDEMPTHLDWRDVDGKDYTTPIKDQHPCGSCQTFCFVAAVESLLKITMDNPFLQPNLSEQHVFSCDGMFPYTLFHPAIYMKESGAADEACMPYDCQDTVDRKSCDLKCEDWQARSMLISDWKFYMFPQPEALVALLQNGPIVAGFQVFEDFLDYTSGVYEHVTGGLKGGHGVAIMGYDSDEQYWICKNSWGTEWGEEGWFKIKWGTGLLSFGYQSMAIDVTENSLCGGNTAPVLGNLAFSANNGEFAPGDPVEFTFSWEDAEANLCGAELFYTVDGGDALRYEFPTVELAGTSSADKELVSFFAAAPAEPGTYDLTVFAKDLCGQESNLLSGSFTVTGESDDDDDIADDDDDADVPTAGDDDDDDDGGSCCG
jgi:Papain family cysteine protease